MKKIIMAVSAGILSLSFAACNSSDSNKTNNTEQAQSSTATTPTETATNNVKPADGILTGYLNLKNSLTVDNSSEAAKNGQEILDALAKFDASALAPEQKKVFMSLSGDLKENSEHINENADKIDHQREHFEMLSKDMYDLVKSVGTDKTLYLDSCPMYDGGKGTWLSEIKEIKNPYLGKKMDTCGAIKETINQ